MNCNLGYEIDPRLMRASGIFLMLLLICVQPQAQVVLTDSLFGKASRLQEQRLKNIFTDNRDSVYSCFDSIMDELSKQPHICTALPDSTHPFFLVDRLQNETKGITLAYGFMNRIVVAESPDERLKAYCWDDLGGGSYHTYFGFLSNTDKAGTCHVLSLDSLFEYPETAIYAIYQAGEKDAPVYVLFGYGTRGGGKQHYRVKFLKNGKECFDCYPDGKGIEIGTTRRQTPQLQFDTETFDIRYKRYVFDEETGFFTNEFEKIVSRYVGGKWVEE